MSPFDSTAAVRRTRLTARFFSLALFVLLSWLIAPHAHAADDCDSKYMKAGAYPSDPLCPLNAASADFGGLGGYVCGDPNRIAAFCSGPSGNDTNEPESPEDSMPDPGQNGNCPSDATAGCGNSTSGADPVNLYTGQFYQYSDDLTVADTAGALALVRVYRSGAYDAAGKPLTAAFGVGMSFTYDTILAMSADRHRLELREATGIRVPFTPRAGSTRIWDNLTSPGEYFRARIDAVGNSGMTMTLRDGRVQQFTLIAGINRLTRLQDRNGNAVVIARDSKTGAVTTVTSPNGRVLSFTLVTGSLGTPLISRVSDPLKREVLYQYDAQDRLVQFTDAGGGVWKYGWDSRSRLTTITDPLNNVQITNTYGNEADMKDRVLAQKLADNSTFGFAYIRHYRWLYGGRR